VDTVLQMGSHQGSVEGEEDLPHPAGHTILDAPQDPIGFLGSQGTLLLAHGHPVVHQDTQVPLHRGSKMPVQMEDEGRDGGCRIQCPGCRYRWRTEGRMEDAGCRVWNAGSGMPVQMEDVGEDGGCGMLVQMKDEREDMEDVGCRVWNAGSGMPVQMEDEGEDAGCGMQGPGCRNR